MKKRHSFRRRLFAGFLLASLLPLLLCSAMLLQIFRLRLDSQLEEESREQLDHVISSLDGLYRGFQQTALALQASPYVAPALSRGQRDSTTVYSELYSATEGSRLSAQFDLYDRDGVWMYSTGSGPVEPVMPTQWGVLYAARQSVGLAFTQVDGGEGNSAPLFRGAARIAGEAGEDAGYLVITLTRADFQRLLEGTYGGQSDLLLLDRYWRPVYASQTALAGRLAVQLREQLLAGEELGQEGEEYAYRAAFQEEMGLYAVLQRPQALNRDTRGLLTTVTVGSALVCVGLSVLMSLRLSRQMFYPIERLHSAIGEVVHNNLDVYVPPYQDDELGELAQRFNGMVVALKRNQEQLVENQRELNEAQIRMLQAQLNPHFLCNTLDTMKWISKINQVPQVALMSTDLADILRFCISPDEFVPLRREVEILRRYMEIQSIRLSGKCRLEVDMPPELEECRVPKMILQPLAENAILHGLDGVEDGVIWVRVRSQGTQTLTISVEDNGRGLPPELMGPYTGPPETSGRGHLGLYNVDTILKKHYGEAYGLRLGSRPGGPGAAVTASLPLWKEEEIC
ncbi:histidine kinase [Clostridium sp.]|uniref:cache domain-containing sensor histidine kinase n=1 Tax=Clostridium sp. TaxID=1506 RepID=UPI00307B2127